MTVVATIARHSPRKRIVPAFCTRSTRRARVRCTARARSRSRRSTDSAASSRKAASNCERDWRILIAG